MFEQSLRLLSVSGPVWTPYILCICVVLIFFACYSESDSHLNRVFPKFMQFYLENFFLLEKFFEIVSGHAGLKKPLFGPKYIFSKIDFLFLGTVNI